MIEVVKAVGAVGCRSHLSSSSTVSEEHGPYISSLTNSPGRGGWANGSIREVGSKQMYEWAPRAYGRLPTDEQYNNLPPV